MKQIPKMIAIDFESDYSDLIIDIVFDHLLYLLTQFI